MFLPWRWTVPTRFMSALLRTERYTKYQAQTKSTEFCNPESKYIWTMTFDSADNLYVGTGANGVIYKVDKGGKKSVFYTCSDNHVVSFLRDGGNNLLAGTSPAGLIIQITPDGKGFALMDTPLEEVHALATDRFGTIYAVASSAKGAGAVSASEGGCCFGRAAAVSVTAVVVESAAGAAEKSKDTKTVTAPGGDKESIGIKSAVYAITKDGSTETVYSSGEQMVYGATVRDDGSLLVATGPKGRLLSVDNAKQVSVISDFPEEDLTQLLAAGDVAYLAGSNRGKVYKLRTQQRAVRRFRIRDAGCQNRRFVGEDFVARRQSRRRKHRAFHEDREHGQGGQLPGAIGARRIPRPASRSRVRAHAISSGAHLSRSARPVPARTGMPRRICWTGFRSPICSRICGLRSRASMSFPTAWSFKSSRRLPASGMSFISPATASDGRSLNAPRERGKDRQPLPPRQVLQPGAQSFTWKASDENEDSLEYSLYFKGEGESEWKLLEKKLADTFYTLNTAALPDGSYRLKVVASDAPSNPYDKFLVGELISDPFVIANAVPQIEVTANKINGKKVEVQFRARVLTGRIATAEFSIDGGEWFLIFPADGIADSAQEEYRILTPELAVGEHLIGIRASDGDGNTGTSKLVVRIR